ncbi:hypothetical protein ACOYW6_12085 [Parablastomonas sp. CN1-191]|uniref:hypothetical protein n=1 Tax=Parablastomonas sp. CN1-191 TaxID=3400908 RepID=UPI003BF8D53B
MADKQAPTREERLAARLRENLHRRKAQGRALAQETPPAAPGAAPPAPLSKDRPDS